MNTYAKRTTELQVGDVVHSYGSRLEVLEVLKRDLTARYTAVTTRVRDQGSGGERDICWDNVPVHVAVPKGGRVVCLMPSETVVPVGILERAAEAADAAADHHGDAIVGDGESDEDDAYAERKMDEANALARALYAAGRGESVDWSAV